MLLKEGGVIMVISGKNGELRNLSDAIGIDYVIKRAGKDFNRAVAHRKDANGKSFIVCTFYESGKSFRSNALNLKAELEGFTMTRRVIIDTHNWLN